MPEPTIFIFKVDQVWDSQSSWEWHYG